MGIEDEIKHRLAQGETPVDLIDEGYAKSTVYKVNRELQRTKDAETGGLTITEVYINNGEKGGPSARVQPGNKAVIDYIVRNDSHSDFYYRRFGVHPHWLDSDQWLAVEESGLIPPGKEERFEVNIDVPENMHLGDYPVELGIDGAYMQSTDAPEAPLPSDTGIQYPALIDLEVKQPMTGEQVFLSHSTDNEELYWPLTKELDNQGIKVILGEEVKQPGRDLRQKFANLIDESDVFICLYTTEASRSDAVQFEIKRAFEQGKPRVPMVEDQATADWPYSDMEYVPFSRHDKNDMLTKAMEGLNNVLEQQRSGPNQELLRTVGAVLIGGVIGKSMANNQDSIEK